mmetsp:Transcript_22673/g.37348  ORF Transcript_22673/g.37348 Transcript_22673/m.37348 type:complete len:310 (+) Transcript_22673:1282-2211(+)
MHKRLNFTSDTVIKTSAAIAVEETVSHPFPGGNIVADFVQQIKRTVHTIFGRHLTHGNRACRCGSVVAQHICRISAGDQDHISSIRPINLLRCNINLPHKFTRVPVIKEYGRVSPLHSKKMTAKKTLSASSSWFNGTSFFEILEEFNPVGRLANGIVSRPSGRPNKINSLPEGFVTQSLCGVNNVLPIPTNCNETTVAIVLDRLRIQLTSPKITRDDGQTLPIRQRILIINRTCKSLNSGCLDFVIFCPNDLSGSVHTNYWIIRSKFNDNTSLVKANSKFRSFPSRGKGPCTLHSIIEGRFSTIGGALP